MKTYALIEGLRQEYDQYTDEDRKVWRVLFERQWKQLQGVVDKNYLEGLDKIGFSAGTIPDFRRVNQRLKELTGWEIVVVPGIIDQRNFFEMLSERKFPSSAWLRSMAELDYLSEPDMFHDAFGHMPLLTNPTFCDFFHRIGGMGMNYENSPKHIEMLGRVYWFTIEFGLIQGADRLKIYGAGILSSIGETQFSIGDVPMRLPFDVKEIMNTDFDNTKIQEKYFVIESFDQLLAAVPEMEKYLASVL